MIGLWSIGMTISDIGEIGEGVELLTMHDA